MGHALNLPRDKEFVDKELPRPVPLFITPIPFPQAHTTPRSLECWGKVRDPVCVHRMMVSPGDSSVWTVLCNNRSNQIVPVDLRLPGSVGSGVNSFTLACGKRSWG